VSRERLPSDAAEGVPSAAVLSGESGFSLTPHETPVNTRNRTLLALSLTAALGALPRAALADERTEARRHFRSGLELVTQRQYVRAIEEFQAAYAILPNVNVLFNIARAYSDLGDLDRAIDYYQRYLQGDVADRAEVEQTLRELEQRRRAASATPPPTPAPVAPTEGTPTVSPSVSPVIPLGALSAEQVTALRNAVNALVQLTSGAPVPATATTPTPAPPTPSPSTPSAAPARGAEDTYEERVVTATLSAQSPLDSPNATTVITAQDIRLSGLNPRLQPKALQPGAGAHRRALGLSRLHRRHALVAAPGQPR